MSKIESVSISHVKVLSPPDISACSFVDEAPSTRCRPSTSRRGRDGRRRGASARPEGSAEAESAASPRAGTTLTRGTSGSACATGTSPSTRRPGSAGEHSEKGNHEFILRDAGGPARQLDIHLPRPAVRLVPGPSVVTSSAMTTILIKLPLLTVFATRSLVNVFFREEAFPQGLRLFQEKIQNIFGDFALFLLLGRFHEH